MPQAYLCPVCRGNRSNFDVIFKMSQEIQKEAETGETLYVSDELVTLVRDDGRPDLDVRCRQCGYVGAEAAFAGAARREDRDDFRPSMRRLRRGS